MVACFCLYYRKKQTIYQIWGRFPRWLPIYCNKYDITSHVVPSPANMGKHKRSDRRAANAQTHLCISVDSIEPSPLAKYERRGRLRSKLRFIVTLSSCSCMLKPFKPNGISCPYQLEQFISLLRVDGWYFSFYSNFDKTFCKQRVENLIRRRFLRRLILVCTVCQCPTKRTIGLYGFKSGFTHIMRSVPKSLELLAHLWSV